MLNAGYEITVMDSLYNATKEALRRVEALAKKPVAFKKVDMLDVPGMDALFAEGGYEAVIHFAGLKAVGESVAKPIFCACASAALPPPRTTTTTTATSSTAVLPHLDLPQSPPHSFPPPLCFHLACALLIDAPIHTA